MKTVILISFLLLSTEALSKELSKQELSYLVNAILLVLDEDEDPCDPDNFGIFVDPDNPDSPPIAIDPPEECFDLERH